MVISNVPGAYANGYDVMIGKAIAEANGWQLEVIQSDWDSLVPGVQTGTFDAVIAGQSMTAERAEQVDFAGPYFYATIVCVTKADSAFANATSIGGVLRLKDDYLHFHDGIFEILLIRKPKNLLQFNNIITSLLKNRATESCPIRLI